MTALKEELFIASQKGIHVLRIGNDLSVSMSDEKYYIKAENYPITSICEEKGLIFAVTN